MFLLITLFAFTQAEQTTPTTPPTTPKKYLIGEKEFETEAILLDTEFTDADGNTVKYQYEEVEVTAGVESRGAIKYCTKGDGEEFNCVDKTTEMGYLKMSVVQELPEHIAYKHTVDSCDTKVHQEPKLVLYPSECFEQEVEQGTQQPPDENGEQPPAENTPAALKREDEPVTPAKKYFKYTLSEETPKKLILKEYSDDTCTTLKTETTTEQTTTNVGQECDTCGDNEEFVCSSYTSKGGNSTDDQINPPPEGGNSTNSVVPDTPTEGGNSTNSVVPGTSSEGGNSTNSVVPGTDDKETEEGSSNSKNEEEESDDSNGTLFTSILLTMMLVVFLF